MKKTKGFTYIEVLISAILILGIMYAGTIYSRNLKEKREINEARSKIIRVFTDYSTKAFDQEKSFNVKIDHLQKKIAVYQNVITLKDEEFLPKTLKYLSVYDNEEVEKLEIKITKNGNITPSFSIYIFGYDDIAKYRLSFYGFDVIQFMKINVYKNISDKKWTYKNIMLYHKKFNPDNGKWRTE